MTEGSDKSLLDPDNGKKTNVMSEINSDKGGIKNEGNGQDVKTGLSENDVNILIENKMKALRKNSSLPNYVPVLSDWVPFVLVGLTVVTIGLACVGLTFVLLMHVTGKFSSIDEKLNSLLNKKLDNKQTNVENVRIKRTIKINEERKLSNEEFIDIDDYYDSELMSDYGLIRDFYLIGGIHDPLSLRFEVTIRDKDGIEHKSAERFYWYKMAEKFGDEDCKKKLVQAPNVQTAEEAVKNIQNFDSKVWDEVRRDIWEEGQRLKLEQVRWICNLLVLTKTTYLAVASEDKYFGIGLRKSRNESNKPAFWDGENEGGKILMNLRHELKKTHTFTGPQEEEVFIVKMGQIDKKGFVKRIFYGN